MTYKRVPAARAASMGLPTSLRPAAACLNISCIFSCRSRSAACTEAVASTATLPHGQRVKAVVPEGWAVLPQPASSTRQEQVRRLPGAPGRTDLRSCLRACFLLERSPFAMPAPRRQAAAAAAPSRAQRPATAARGKPGRPGTLAGRPPAEVRAEAEGEVGRDTAGREDEVCRDLH